MINDEALMIKIEELTKNYQGDISHFYEAVGMVILGRFFGWRVMRLVSSGLTWSRATKLFGDLKDPELMPERGDYAYKSVGLALVDKAGDYWEVIKRHKSIPMQERRAIQ